MRMRGTLVLATVAALLGAPSLVSAAGNTLSAAAPGGPSHDALVERVLLIGLFGVAAVAVIGTALLLVSRRRRDDGEPSAAARAPAGTEALLERRSVRRASVRLADDPIVAAMGVDEQVAARRRRTAGEQAPSGPGQRRVRLR